MPDSNESQPAMLAREPLLLIMDGHALIHRAWHAIREPLTTRSNGEDVRAIFGFLNIFLKTLNDRSPTHVAATFDVSAPTFRHERFAEYKAHRPSTPPELRPQFERVKELMRAFRVPIYEREGFEADDVIGALCRQAEEQGVNAIVLTGDTDTLQLASPSVSVLLSHAVGRRTVYDPDGVRERYDGLGPESVADIKALEGDSSDNIPGVPRVGRKTAIKLLKEFQTIDGIYENIESVKPPSVQKSLAENRDKAFEARFLTTIMREVEGVSLDMSDCVFGDFSRSEVEDSLRSLEFFSMISRIPASSGDGGEGAGGQGAFDLAGSEPEPAPVDYEIVDDESKLSALAAALDAPDGFSFDTETTSKDPMLARLVGLSFSTEPRAAWYVPVGHAEGRQLPMERVLEVLSPILANPEVPKTAHNANYDIMALANHGVRVDGLAFDTMIAARAAGDRREVGLKNLALEMLGEEMSKIEDLIGRGRKQKSMAEVEISQAADYAAADADMTERLRRELAPEMESKGLGEMLRRYELPLTHVLVRMQRWGVAVDPDLLNRMSAELEGDLDDIMASMYAEVGHEFNLNSSRQLAGVLYDELRLAPTRKTRTGGFSTDAAALEEIKERMDAGEMEGADPRAYKVLDYILNYRQLSKIKSTYVDALPELVNPDTGRIHTKYNQTGSATGRISSSDPNMQNIPVRTELGRRVRRAFGAEDGSVLLAADYSQIELRVLAHFSRDPELLAAFHRGEDIHSATSSLVYGAALDEVTAEMRRIAKILNFGVLYGLTAYGISRQTDLTPAQGQDFIDIYFERYPRVREYTRETVRECKESGYVQTALGRRRYLPNINARNFQARSAAERAAINMPIQGTAADIIKIAMIEIMKRMDADGMKSKMIMQVHDELIFEVPRGEVEPMSALVSELMPASLDLAVPLAVELKTGDNWGDME